MHPPWSMIFFTTLAGAAQGLLLALVGADAAAALGLTSVPDDLRHGGAAVVLVLGGIGLAAATFHLGHPLRAWRAAAMWRTSWLSREVIVLPAFLALTLAWAATHAARLPTWSLGCGLAAAALALLLYLCTGMIYGAVSAIREWATPLTPLNFALLGGASGLLLAAALAARFAPALAPGFASIALALTLVGAVTRGASAWRNHRLAPKTTLQSAIGVRHPRIVQTSQGAMGGSFNTREFFHGRSARVVGRMRWLAAVLAFGLPAAALAIAPATPSLLLALVAMQWLGLLAERWVFFAEARHPQNLYYQRVG
ncbi:MAG TPA: DmsC/YnfH family molybdoenzyme membrane anchor subunit [Burkholderiaceae bacterium]|nr:DmsC/YnfH family molybdoenzyme membrane anchor subunit [Burkholderiaceae bacterium]